MTLDFRGLWFSGDELARMRSGDAHVTPSDDIALASWDAASTDTPHPDIVNAQIRIVVPADARRLTTVVRLREQWQIGERGGEAAARWDEAAQRSSPPVDLVPGTTVSVSLPVAVGDMVRRQLTAGRTPYRLALRAELHDTAQAPILATAQAMLPILTLP